MRYLHRKIVYQVIIEKSLKTYVNESTVDSDDVHNPVVFASSSSSSSTLLSFSLIFPSCFVKTFLSLKARDAATLSVGDLIVLLASYEEINAFFKKKLSEERKIVMSGKKNVFSSNLISWILIANGFVCERS